MCYSLQKPVLALCNHFEIDFLSCFFLSTCLVGRSSSLWPARHFQLPAPGSQATINVLACFTHCQTRQFSMLEFLLFLTFLVGLCSSTKLHNFIPDGWFYFQPRFSCQQRLLLHEMLTLMFPRGSTFGYVVGKVRSHFCPLLWCQHVPFCCLPTYFYFFDFGSLVLFEYLRLFVCLSVYLVIV